MIINVRGISQGQTHLSDRLDPREFNLDYRDAHLASPVSVEAAAVKMGREIYVDAKVNADVELGCSRCLARHTLTFKGRLQCLYVPSDTREQRSATGGDFSFYDHDTIDLSEDIRSLISRELPRKPLCREDCKGLCPRCGKLLNEGPCDCPPPDTGYKPFEGLDLS